MPVKRESVDRKPNLNDESDSEDDIPLSKICKSVPLSGTLEHLPISSIVREVNALVEVSRCVPPFVAEVRPLTTDRACRVLHSRSHPAPRHQHSQHMINSEFLLSLPLCNKVSPSTFAPRWDPLQNRLAARTSTSLALGLIPTVIRTINNVECSSLPIDTDTRDVGESRRSIWSIRTSLPTGFSSYR